MRYCVIHRARSVGAGTGGRYVRCEDDGANNMEAVGDDLRSGT